jgi:glucose/mannose-6-phosphate isomerase
VSLGIPVDSIEMWEASLGLPEQVATAERTGRAVALVDDDPVSHVVVIGVGADGFAGDVVRAATAPELPVPLVVVKSNELPGFVDQSSLVFAVSWSGETPTTVTAAAEALVRGASLVGVGGPGTLQDLARRAGAPFVPVPKGLPQARAAVGALAVPILVILERMGLVPDMGTQLAAAVDQLSRRRDELRPARVTASGHEPARPADVAVTAARRIGRTLPLIHGSRGLVGVAAQRWKTQINENAKSPAFWSEHPDLCYNELAGWGQSGDVTRQLITLVQLRTDREDADSARRFDAEAEVLREVVADVVPVVAQGSGPLARFFDLALIGDLVSLHLAAAEDVDPGPVPVVADMERLTTGDIASR